MNYFIKNERVAVLTDLQIKSGKSDGSRALSAGEIEILNTGNFKVINGEVVLGDGVSKDHQIASIDAQLVAINLAMIRPQNSILSAQLGGDEVDSDDTDRLISLENQAISLRADRVALLND